MDESILAAESDFERPITGTDVTRAINRLCCDKGPGLAGYIDRGLLLSAAKKVISSFLPDTQRQRVGVTQDPDVNVSASTASAVGHSEQATSFVHPGNRAHPVVAGRDSPSASAAGEASKAGSHVLSKALRGRWMTCFAAVLALALFILVSFWFINNAPANPILSILFVTTLLVAGFVLGQVWANLVLVSRERQVAMGRRLLAAQSRGVRAQLAELHRLDEERRDQESRGYGSEQEQEGQGQAPKRAR